GPELPAGVRPIRELGVQVRLPMEPHANRAWTGAGVQRYLDGERPPPAEVFRQVVGVVGRFMDFNRSFAPPEVVVELMSGFVLASYLLDAFDVAPFLWPTGDKGSGKSNLLYTTTEMAYLGLVVLAGGPARTPAGLAGLNPRHRLRTCPQRKGRRGVGTRDPN